MICKQFATNLHLSYFKLFKAPRLNLPAKQLRRTLQFLEEEQLVKHELVDDLAMGGSQNTKFWYIE